MEPKKFSPRGYQVTPRKIESIRAKAIQSRIALGLGPDRFDAAPLLDRLSVEFNIHVDIVEDNEVSNGVEATSYPGLFFMRIPERTWDAIESGEPRARFTFMHELGHLILQHDFSLHRENSPVQHKAYEDSEWQADQFAAEVLMPLSVINACKLFDAVGLAEFFDVSLPAAEVRLRQLRKRNELKEIR
ncbi:ImmA/IrrE family metallo-endopeptidase [Chromobacterium sp.]|uniref:ImmA/IrrE family metallo-endopeptidase n=1 Tax=Chromobacterium sp. TaxID=306190 RepID=UPI0035B46617